MIPIAVNDKVVIQILDVKTTNGKIIMPDLGKEVPLIGKVLNVGRGYYTMMGNLIPPEVKKDDIVVIPRFGAQTIKIEGKEYIVCKESDILATLSNKEEN